MLEILLFLFQNYLDNGSSGSQTGDPQLLAAQLHDAGFDEYEIHQAFNWLENIGNTDLAASLKNSSSMRHYNYEERHKITVESRGFLLFLEQSAILDPVSRELSIDRAMALNTDEINLEQMQWIVLMVMFNQPAQKAALAWLENHILDSNKTTLH